MTKAPTSLDLHEALASELLEIKLCALAVQHVAKEANPLPDLEVDAVMQLAVNHLQESVENAFAIAARMRQAAD